MATKEADARSERNMNNNNLGNLSRSSKYRHKHLLYDDGEQTKSFFSDVSWSGSLAVEDDVAMLEEEEKNMELSFYVPCPPPSWDVVVDDGTMMQMMTSP